MEFIPGKRIALEGVTMRHIDHAISFYEDLNRHRSNELARSLPAASEACFSLYDHLSVTQSRMDRLAEIEPHDQTDRDAAALAGDGIIPLWGRIRTRIEKAIANGEHGDEELAQEERCVSPSDFGMHNALEMADGSVRFFDFEYAGWDDPAKLMADFANQPDMTLERSLSDRFSEAVIARHPYPQKLRMRARLLEPLYQAKWACICLNDFLLEGRSRRDFASQGSIADSARKAFQLDRARAMLQLAKDNFSQVERSNGTT